MVNGTTTLSDRVLRKEWYASPSEPGFSRHGIVRQFEDILSFLAWYSV